MYRATCSTEDESNATSVFVKMAPEDETKRMLMRIHECFIRERYVYEAVTAKIFELEWNSEMEKKVKLLLDRL